MAKKLFLKTFYTHNSYYVFLYKKQKYHRIDRYDNKRHGNVKGTTTELCCLQKRRGSLTFFAFFSHSPFSLNKACEHIQYMNVKRKEKKEEQKEHG